MMILVRAVVTGFGLSLGSALYKKVAARIGFDDESEKEKAKDKAREVNQQDAATDPSLS